MRRLSKSIRADSPGFSPTGPPTPDEIGLRPCRASARLGRPRPPAGVVAVRNMLKTGLLDFSDEQADELENHLIATGIAGRTPWTGDDWSAAPPIGGGRAQESRFIMILM